jgi:hypothetical protein
MGFGTSLAAAVSRILVSRNAEGRIHQSDGCQRFVGPQPLVVSWRKPTQTVAKPGERAIVPAREMEQAVNAQTYSKTVTWPPQRVKSIPALPKRCRRVPRLCGLRQTQKKPLGTKGGRRSEGFPFKFSVVHFDFSFPSEQCLLAFAESAVRAVRR